MELASRAFLNIYARKKETVDSNFKKINLSSEQGFQILRLAALLHDIGHLPFSHGGEAILPNGKKHEDVSIEVVKSLETNIDTLFFSGSTSLAIQLIQKDLVIPELGFLKSILSGSIDVDRMDYLARDSHHCGVEYGIFDYNRLLESITVLPGRYGGLELAIDHGGIHSLEALILARYDMFTQVYCHRTRRIYDIYLERFMEAWAPPLETLMNVLKYDDTDLITIMREKQSENIYAHNICSRIIR